jgi:tRNA threonylcarbamoyladenosine biosynthesis protein TsaE
MTEVVHTRSEGETAATAAKFAARLRAGALVLLYGDLGAGKTAFVRGMAAGLGIDPGEISSPTFTLIQEYRGARGLSHVDLYRVEGAEIEDLGLEELSAEGSVVAIEWADKLRECPPEAIRVVILDRGGNCREISITVDSGQLTGVADSRH